MQLHLLSHTSGEGAITLSINSPQESAIKSAAFYIGGVGSGESMPHMNKALDVLISTLNHTKLTKDDEEFISVNDTNKVIIQS